MLALVDKTKSLSNQISDMKGETKSAATELQEAKHEICKLKEERELLRATLTQAGRSGSQTIKIVRPVSAPRARQAPAQADRPGSARAPVAACEGCDVLEVRIRETQTLLQEAQEANTALSDKIETLDQEKRAWQARAPPARKPDAPGPLPAAAATPAATSNGDSTKEIAALKQKVAQLEKTVVAKTKEAKAAADSAAADKKRADKLAKEAKDKDATIADLEKQLADALGKVSTLEKRLHDTSLNLKATSDSRCAHDARPSRNHTHAHSPRRNAIIHNHVDGQRCACSPHAGMPAHASGSCFCCRPRSRSVSSDAGELC